MPKYLQGMIFYVSLWRAELSIVRRAKTKPRSFDRPRQNLREWWHLHMQTQPPSDQELATWERVEERERKKEGELVDSINPHTIIPSSSSYIPLTTSRLNSTLLVSSSWKLRYIVWRPAILQAFLKDSNVKSSPNIWHQNTIVYWLHTGTHKPNNSKLLKIRGQITTCGSMLR